MPIVDKVITMARPGSIRVQPSAPHRPDQANDNASSMMTFRSRSSFLTVFIQSAFRYFATHPFFVSRQRFVSSKTAQESLACPFFASTFLASCSHTPCPDQNPGALGRMGVSVPQAQRKSSVQLSNASFIQGLLYSARFGATLQGKPS